MTSRIVSFWLGGIGKLGRVEGVGPLLARLSIGAVFFQSGLGKLQNLERTIEFFRELGIFAPELQARFVGGLELVGGICIALGLATRLFSLPLAFTMVVAVLTAQLSEIDGLLSLFALSEVTIMAVLLWLVVAGPGWISLDHLIAQRARRDTLNRPAQFGN